MLHMFDLLTHSKRLVYAFVAEGGSSSVHGLPPNDSFKPTPLRGAAKFWC